MALVYEDQKFPGHSLSLTLISLSIIRLLFSELYSILLPREKASVSILPEVYG